MSITADSMDLHGVPSAVEPKALHLKLFWVKWATCSVRTSKGLEKNRTSLPFGPGAFTGEGIAKRIASAIVYPTGTLRIDNLYCSCILHHGNVYGCPLNVMNIGVICGLIGVLVWHIPCGWGHQSNVHSIS